MGRAPCCDKANVKKGPWSPEEDAKLKSYIEQQGTGGNWIALPQKIGLKRCGKSCRLRWLNYLRPNIKHGGFSEEEDNIICSLYISIGSRWSIIAAQLPGRTDNDIKNYWNTRLKKKLLGKQRKQDQTQGRRVGGGAKQEANKREESGNLAAASDGGSIRSTYWPETAMPMYPIGLAGHRTDDEHTSFRKMLLKLGGRFSGDNGASHASPFLVPSSVPPPPPPPPSYHDSSASLVAASVHASNSYNEGSHGFSTELDEIFCSNPVKLEGLEYCFYGSGGMIGESTGSSSTESMNWPEVSPLAYPNMAQSYQGMQQCLFEEPVHLGMQ